MGLNWQTVKSEHVRQVCALLRSRRCTHSVKRRGTYIRFESLDLPGQIAGQIGTDPHGTTLSSKELGVRGNRVAESLALLRWWCLTSPSILRRISHVTPLKGEVIQKYNPAHASQTPPPGRWIAGACHPARKQQASVFLCRRGLSFLPRPPRKTHQAL